MANTPDTSSEGSPQSAKDAARQQSRPVPTKGAGRQARTPARTPAPRPSTAKTTGTKSSGSSGTKPSGAKPKTTTNRSTTTQRSSTRPLQADRRPAGRRWGPGTIAWISIAVVLVVVLVVVVINVTSSTGKSGNGSSPAPESIVTGIQTIPASVYNTVGVNSPEVPVTPPSVISGQPPLTLTVGDHTLPGVFYLGAEYCPFCAAERWAIASALARFGTFDGLRITSSSTVDKYPGTPTLSFYKATLASDYIAFQPVEVASNEIDAAGTGYIPLETPNKQQSELADKYDTTKYVTSLSSSSEDGSIPFLDIGNRMLLSGASYTPVVLTGLSHQQIVDDLHDPTSAVAQPIITTANYLSAGICDITHNQPGSVCDSKGVMAAKKALHLS